MEDGLSLEIAETIADCAANRGCTVVFYDTMQYDTIRGLKS